MQETAIDRLSSSTNGLYLTKINTVVNNKN